ncbi:MAG: DUF2971 domain-containing protein [Kiritimatiellae bacterium]|nr:DUF2971 domain-containing protein [Kiritimatiellia bacterium]
MKAKDISRPKVLYKFLGKHGGTDALRNLTILFSPADKFNDPFECVPGGLSPTDVAAVIREGCQVSSDMWKWIDFCKKYNLFDGPDFGKELLRYNAKNNLLQFFAGVSADGTSRIAARRNEIFIACFSACKDSLLLWSHYAEQHKGIVIGYKTLYLPEVYPVKYSETRVEIPYGPNHSRDWVKDVFTTKYTDWKYEYEWRSLNPNPSSQEHSNGGLLHPIDADGIAEITLGACADKELFDECLSFVKHHRKCHLFKASMHAYAYKLDFERVKVS